MDDASSIQTHAQSYPEWLCTCVPHVTITYACSQMPPSYYPGALRREIDEPDLVSAGVMSATACDMDNHCRKVLGSLDQDRSYGKFFLVGNGDHMGMVSG